MTDSARREPSTALEYHRPVPLLDRVVARLRVEHFAVTVALGGFAVALFFGGPRYRSDLIRIVLGWFGMLMLVAGTVGYVVLRVRSRKLMPAWLRVQLVLATVMSLLGVLAAVSFAEASEGPRGLQYWLTYNQTYAHNPVRAIKSAWMVPAGVAWFVAVLLSQRVLAGRAAPCPPPGESK